MKYQVKGSGGRTWIQTLRTVNILGTGASLNFTLSGRMLAFDGVERVRAQAKAGSKAGGESGPGLQIFPQGSLTVDAGASAINIKILNGPPLELPAHLSWVAAGRNRLLTWPVFLNETDQVVPRKGAAISSSSYAINYRGKRPRWVAIDYITSFVEIPWKIEVKSLPVGRPYRF